MEICRYLMAHPGRHFAREELTELLWPEADEALTSHRLHVAISALRHAVDRPDAHNSIIVFDGDAYFISSGAVVTDCELFDQHYQFGRRRIAQGDLAEAAAAFTRALELYGGDYLADAPYMEWTHQARAHFMERRLSALSFLCEQAAREGNFSQVIELALSILEVDNLREMAHRYLMRAHYHIGQRAVAIRQFEACAELLRRELGVRPSRQTRALYEAIRDDAELPTDTQLLM
jgi:DNA-binding SARP family transcriptional activator